MREAFADDVPFITGLFRLPHVRRFLVSPGRGGIEGALDEPGVESYVIETARGTALGYFTMHEHARSIAFTVLAIRRPGRGAGTFALQWAIDRAFNELGARRITLQIRRDNARTQAICERLGFRRTGAPDAHDLIAYELKHTSASRMTMPP